jgi:Tol biopolymer transport system component
MGEVYKATDTRLDRVVAIKVLSPDLAATPEMKVRFEREAKAVSALSHPHICALYDVGSASGVEYLVMEYLEGETLEDRLGKGALPVEQVLKFGVQIADALERAHRQGIVHRDLKPGNVMLTRSGVKLLDFGLARSLAPSADSGGVLSSLPTQAEPSRLTERGTIMGTFQYMSPEQLEGKETDARSDIFALGAVLYEMATGKKAFYGASRASLISSILRDEPRPISADAPMTPPAFERVVKTCLAKDPNDRFETAHDVKLQLQWLAEAGSQAGAPVAVVSRRRSRERLAWIVAGAAIAAALALALIFARRPPPSARTLRAAIELPEGALIDKQNASLALSPGGRTLAFVAEGADGKLQIYLRALDGVAAPALAGTEDATYPFWSPDGRSLGFFSGGKLKRIDVSGSAVQTICDAPQGRGATWGPDGTIVFTPTVYGTMQRISASGGSPAAAEAEVPPGSASHRNPHFLPDGRSVLYYSSAVATSDASLAKKLPGEGGVYALDLSTKKARLVLSVPSEAYFVEPHYLAFVRQKNVMVQRFDPKSLRLSGEPVPVAEKVEYNGFRGTAEFTFGGSDLFVYQRETLASLGQLAWFDLDGKKLSAVGESATISGLAVSPDGRQAAVVIDGPDGSQIWIADLTAGGRYRFSFGTDAASDPVWSPDGRQLAYAAHLPDGESIQVKETAGGAPPRTIYKGFNFASPESWSPDGKSITFSMQSTGTKSFDIGIVPAIGGAIRMIVASPGNERDGLISPDGHWLAYDSEESGRTELYVTRYPEAGAKWQISSGGLISNVGSGSFWWTSAGEIAYAGADRRAYAVAVKPEGTGLSIGAPRRFFGDTLFPREARGYASAARRLLVAVPAGLSKPTPLTVVTNWAAALPR